MFKAGPVLCVNHGMGAPSVSILLHELFKLLHYAGCLQVTFIRMGTCGGLGVPPGTIVVSKEVINEFGEPNHTFVSGQVTAGTVYHCNICINSCTYQLCSGRMRLGVH